jgi:hypothetical protein
MIRQPSIEKQQRLGFKNLDEMFRRQLEIELNCSPIESKAVVEMVKDTYFPYLEQPQEIQAGKMVFLAIDAQEPPGKPLKSCQFKQVLLTYFDPDVENEIQNNNVPNHVTYRRRKTILRMANETKSQGALLTAEDLAYKILNCGMRTITRDLKYFKEQNVIVPLRGQQRDIGRGLTHQAKIVEAYLDHKTYSQIQQMYQHSIESIDNYVQTFLRVVFLASQNNSHKEIAFLVKSSLYLVKQYLALYVKLNANPFYEKRISQLMKSLSKTKKNNSRRGNHETR